ncbi:MAG: hypothetical protein AB2L26_06800 [Ignavibacteria bacterium]
MDDQNIIDPKDRNVDLDSLKNEMLSTLTSPIGSAIEKVIMAALGIIPWVGGFIAAIASIKSDQKNIKREKLQYQWIDEYTNKMKKLVEALTDINERFKNLGDTIDERIQSEQYLDVVRKAFRAWDESDTDEKRNYIKNLIANAAGTKICSDDVLRLFIDWLKTYHEAHFAVIGHIYGNPNCTRYNIWLSLHGKLEREDSAEADLFKLLIRDLSTGGVIRQVRAITYDGHFLKKPSVKGNIKSSTMESAFEDTKPYELTELGKQFVHYSMTEIVKRVNA